MKIVDLEYEDIMHEIKQNVPRQIARMKYHQKYLLLELGNEVYELEISDVTDTAFYLKVKDEDYGMTKRFKSECTDCKYFTEYQGIRCLMKQEFCIIGGKTSYPTDCRYFEKELKE